MNNLEHALIQVRTDRAHTGQRECPMALMREVALPVQRRLGMRVLGPFPSLDDSETFAWLRVFPPGADRDALKRAFYEGPEWTGKLEQLLMPPLQGYGSMVVEDHDRLWQQWPGESE
jgi:hypothetical protein